MGGRMTTHHIDMYPHVLSEFETMQRVVAGASLARYGDGEFKLCEGSGIKSQDFDPVLARRMREILHDSGECLVGIPNIQSATPKRPYWSKHAEGFSRHLAGRTYVSSFVSRADSAPWINDAPYWDLVEQLWRGKDVTLVRGSGKAFKPPLLIGAGAITEIFGPKRNAWSSYDELMERIGTPGVAILCLGPTATVMAVDLCRKGVHAIDSGHMGRYFRDRARDDADEAAAA
jgi:hypothetical protein